MGGQHRSLEGCSRKHLCLQTGQQSIPRCTCYKIQEKKTYRFYPIGINIATTLLCRYLISLNFRLNTSACCNWQKNSTAWMSSRCRNSKPGKRALFSTWQASLLKIPTRFNILSSSSIGSMREQSPARPKDIASLRAMPRKSLADKTCLGWLISSSGRGRLQFFIPLRANPCNVSAHLPPSNARAGWRRFSPRRTTMY